MSSPTGETPLHETVGARIAVVVFLLATLAYALFIAQQILLWVVLFLTVVSLWYAARLVVALERIATHLDRLAETQTPENRRTEE